MAEHILLERTFDSAASTLLNELTGSDCKFEQVDVWLFEDQERREAIAAELASHGMTARVHSAYKPLIHFFLEDVATDGLTAIHVTYPVHPAWPRQRFRLEAYPLAAMFSGVKLHFAPAPAAPAGAQANAWYQVQLHYGERRQTHDVFAPNLLREDDFGEAACKVADATEAVNKTLQEDFLGLVICRPSAWLLARSQGGTMQTPLPSAFQQCYDAIMTTVAAHDWQHSEPYFERLVIRADLPGIERPLSVDHETISTTEALQEDAYFSLLEFFQRYSGRTPGSRGLQPGQIVPDIRLSQDGPARVRIHYEDTAASRQDDAPVAIVAAPANGDTNQDALANAASPLTHDEVHDALSRFAGDHFGFHSRQQRIVEGVHVGGARPAVLISGAQHANETTGVVGALRAAGELQHAADAHFVLMPVENPDGYALHEELRTHNPRYMHHAARYSALGDDIEYRQHAPWYERSARNHAFAISDARLHLNLHGYPAHEWTRPCTGYLPRGFELWSIPKGFFLILRYRSNASDKAHALLTHVTRELARNGELMAYNKRQLETYQQHADSLPFEIMHGMPYMATAVDTLGCDVTLITEFPDETIYGEAFRFGHSVQMETVLAATHWWWDSA